MGIAKFTPKPEDDSDGAAPWPLLVTETVDAWDGLGDENKRGDWTEDLIGVFEFACEDGCADDGISSEVLHYYTIKIITPRSDSK